MNQSTHQRNTLSFSRKLNVNPSLPFTTMPSDAVVLIMGAGPRIGAAVAERFSSNGYQVALASRSGGSGTKNDKSFLSLKADFSQPDMIPSLFKAVKAEFHSPPNVVVYNAGSLTNPPEKDDPLSIAAEDVQKDFVVNTVTPYVAAHEAVKAWEELPGEMKKSFIYTGNVTNVSIVPMPLMVNVGMGKAAAAYWIGTADAAYEGRGYR